MKKVIILALLITLIPTTASAEETGAWVAVDDNGNAISEAIVCTPSVCGEPYSFMGKRWILQAPATADGGVAGVGANQGMDSVKVDLETGVWTTTKSTVNVDPITKQSSTSVSVQQFTPNKAPWLSMPPAPIQTPIKVNLYEPIEIHKIVKPFVPTQLPLIMQQEAIIADLYAQLEKLKKAKRVKRAKK